MKTIYWFLIFLLLFSFGCSPVKEERVVEDVVAKEVFDEEEKEVVVWDPFFDLLEQDEHFILTYFSEEEPLLMNSSFIFFEENIIIYFAEEKSETIVLFKGNEILGFLIEEKFNKKNIVSYFGEPYKEGKDGERNYLTYSFPNKINIVFWEEKDDVSPMSAHVFFDH